MRIQTYVYPKSSFLSIEKDLDVLTGLMMKNERLKRLLYYTVPDALDKGLPNLTSEQSIELFKKNIKIVPKLYIDGSVLNYIIISLDNFTPNATNPEFRDNIVSFDIICHFDQWQLEDNELRPYRIAAELDTILDNQRLTGIGKVEFLGASQIILNDEFGGLSLMYSVTHGEEDKVNMLNPKKDEEYKKDFNQMWND